MLLALTTLILAAKINEPVRPGYDITAHLLPNSLQQQVSKSEFITLESHILTLLKFDLQYTSPIFFLGRYQILFGLDTEQNDFLASSVGSMARNFCLLMLRESHFLNYKPSQIASASIMFAMYIINNRVDSNTVPMTA